MSNAWLVERKALHDQLASYLRDMILEGIFQPGEKLPEQILCDRFGVSRTPLREALRVLAAEGIITLTPHRGARIALSTMDEIEELYPLIGALEGLAGELACERITDAEISHIEDLHNRMVAHYSNGEVVAFKKLNGEIHEAILEAAQNPSLMAHYRNLMVRTHSARSIVRMSPARWREAIDDHERMIDALRRRDGDRLGQILREHLKHKIGIIREAFEGMPKPHISAA